MGFFFEWEKPQGITGGKTMKKGKGIKAKIIFSIVGFISLYIFQPVIIFAQEEKESSFLTSKRKEINGV